jgi:hypothetical protein
MPLQHHIFALVFHDFEALGRFGPLGALVPHSDYNTLELCSQRPRLGSPTGP